MEERKRVLIIDDEVDFCMLLKSYFLRKNYDVYMAHSFSDALPRLRECLPNLIFLTSESCQNLDEDIKKIKESVPDAEIIVDRFH